MMKQQISGMINTEIISAEEARRFSGSLVRSENRCCLGCSCSTGGLVCIY